MIRRLKKVTSQAELQQLIDAGIIASPYIAFDSSSNVTNMVLPAEREISEIEYEQEVSSPVKLVGAVTPEYYVQEGYTACRLSFEINAEYIDSHDYVFLLMCQKSYFDNALANSAVSKEEFISTILLDAYNDNDKTLDFRYAYAVKFNLRSAFPFDTDVPCIVSEENMAGDDLIWVPYGDEYPTDNTYYLFYGYRPTGEEEFDMVGEVAQYRVMPYLSDDSNFVFDGMNLISYEKLDPDTGESMGQYRNFEARVPGNTVYDRARYAWYLDGESDTEALENGRTATCNATTTFAFEDYDAPEYINETGQTLEGFIVVQLYNSVTGAESKVKNFSTMYVEPTEGGDDASIRLLSPINREDAWEERGNFMYSKLNFTAAVQPYEGESDLTTIYPVFRFIRKSDYLTLAEENETEGYGWSAKELLWNAAAYPGDYEDAEPEDTPDNWDSSVNFEVDNIDVQGPSNPQDIEDDGVDGFTWMLIAVYTDGGDLTWGDTYPGDDAVYGLGEIYIPMYSPVTIDGSILYELGHVPEDEFPEYEARLKFTAFTSHFNDSDYTNLKFMFVNKTVFNNGYRQGLSNADIIADALNRIPDGPDNGYFTVNTDSSVQGYYITSWYCDGSDVSTGDFDCIYLPTCPEEDYEGDDGYTYWLVAGYEYKPDGEYAPNAPAVGIVGSVRVPYYLESNSVNILKYGYMWVNDNDGNKDYWYDTQVTPNSCYPQVGVGLYSKEAFETAYTESGTSDSSTEYLNTYQDDGNMLEYTYDFDVSNGFISSDQFDPEDIPGYTEGDTICMALWFLDENDDIAGDVTYVAKLGEEEEETPDVSLGYKFVVGQNNTGYFNTGYVPGIDTVVQLRGTIIDDGDIAHGIKTGHGEWQYRIFGYAGAVYYDRVDDNVRLNAYEDLSVPNDYEFGNFYIKINGNTVANDTESDLTNFFTEQQLFVFAGSEQGAMGESIPAAYAAQGTQLEYFKILEPDGNGGLNLEMDLRPALDASGNICLYDQVSGEAIYPEGGVINIVATEIGGDDTPDASVYSTAYISSFEADPQQEWTDENSNVHVMLTPIIEMTNNDASMNYFQLGMYDAAEEGNAWDPIENLYEWACENSYVELSSVFNGDASVSFNAGAYMNVDSYQQANDGATFKFVGRYVNGYTQNTTDEWGNQYEELVISESKPWIILGQYPAPEPEVMYGTFTYGGENNATFDAYLNEPAVEEGCYYKAGCTSNSDWNTLMEEQQNMADWDAYIQDCVSDSPEYTGTEDNPDTITVTFPNPQDDDGDVIVALYDSEGNYLNYFSLGAWNNYSL